MFHFHLTKYWFDQIKSGNKRCEYRLITDRMRKIVHNELSRSSVWPAKIYCGYPKSSDKERVLDVVVKEVNIFGGFELPPRVKEFLKPASGDFYYQFVLSEVSDA